MPFLWSKKPFGLDTNLPGLSTQQTPGGYHSLGQVIVWATTEVKQNVQVVCTLAWEATTPVHSITRASSAHLKIWGHSTDSATKWQVSSVHVWDPLNGSSSGFRGWTVQTLHSNVSLFLVLLALRTLIWIKFSITSYRWLNWFIGT
jgi:hypothetical protein